ncbi:MAG: methylenetetrahydrofolate reductase [NAD(P)H] [Piscirickettsiaceae bacterium]|nr:methylenetetrahydrofolate reductase [NAD(P)H] [Piscirickettsiaceae bacterium]
MSHNLILSCEFFPPQTDKGKAKIRHVRQQLAPLQPKFYSVTFGAGGSTQGNTLNAVMEIQKDQVKTGIDAAPHLSCVGSTIGGIRKLLNIFQSNGIHRIIALRGDFPSGMRDPGDFRYANELVRFIRKETGNFFNIEVAAYPEVHPQAPSTHADLTILKRKVDAGANGAITQYFYNIDAYLHLIEHCQQNNIDIPIIPGIMPINNFLQLKRFSDACGAEIPRWLRKRLEGFQDDKRSLEAFTIDFLTSFTQNLINAGVPGLHFYSMNRTYPTFTICQRLGLIHKM